MNPPSPENALSLEVDHDGDRVEARLIAHSKVAQRVSYDLVMSGQSTSRHHAETSLAPDRRAVVSTMRMTVGDRWCVRVAVEEGDGRQYELREGEC
ncbi:MAG: hypothetical protein HEQ22_05200 [Sphingopyxis sp.]|uniref:curli-like amyloid fiber formation chaperone CsgH n=1 Tax=Sphingopyxis sp. TaxID=1908224 RepID=UPI003D80BCB4